MSNHIHGIKMNFMGIKKQFCRKKHRDKACLVSTIQNKIFLGYKIDTIILERHKRYKKDFIKNQKHFLYLLNEKKVTHINYNSNAWLLFVANFELCMWN